MLKKDLILLVMRMLFTVSKIHLIKNNFKNSFDVQKKILVFPERNFQVGKYLELRFEFRTSEMQGMILSVAEPVGFPAISIELHKGKVKQ